MAKKKKIPMWRILGFPTPLQIVVNGKEKSPYRVYRIWKHIIRRANCPPAFRRSRNYKYYAHVTICDEWRYFEAFYFWAMLTGYSDNLTIDRIDGRKGYCPENCRWATLSEQNKNRHYTDAFREAAQRNLAKANAVLWAKREARRGRGSAAGIQS